MPPCRLWGKVLSGFLRHLLAQQADWPLTPLTLSLNWRSKARFANLILPSAPWRVPRASTGTQSLFGGVLNKSMIPKRQNTVLSGTLFWLFPEYEFNLSNEVFKWTRDSCICRKMGARLGIRLHVSVALARDRLWNKEEKVPVLMKYFKMGVGIWSSKEGHASEKIPQWGNHFTSEESSEHARWTNCVGAERRTGKRTQCVSSWIFPGREKSCRLVHVHSKAKYSWKHSQNLSWCSVLSGYGPILECIHLYISLLMWPFFKNQFWNANL